MGLSGKQPTGSVGGVVCKQRGGESRRVVRVVCDPVVGVPGHKHRVRTILRERSANLQKPLRVGGVDKRRGSSVQKPIGKCGWHLEIYIEVVRICQLLSFMAYL